jgi:hypothetical protein
VLLILLVGVSFSNLIHAANHPSALGEGIIVSGIDGHGQGAAACRMDTCGVALLSGGNNYELATLPNNHPESIREMAFYHRLFTNCSLRKLTAAQRLQRRKIWIYVFQLHIELLVHSSIITIQYHIIS